MDIERSLELSSKATPGPWTLEKRGCGVGCCDDLNGIMAQYPQDETPTRHIGTIDGGNAVWLREGEAQANAAFIADAREGYPELLKRFKRLRELIGFYYRQINTGRDDLVLANRHFAELRSLLSLDGKDGA